MLKAGTDWNPRQAKLKELLARPECFGEAKELLFALHSLVHSADVYGTAGTYMDEVWEGLDGRSFTTMPTVKDVTLAWNIWHITRIEDLTVNLLIGRGQQVLDVDWLKKLNTSVTDAANAMTDDEIIALSRELDGDALKAYRDTVGQRTKAILKGLHPEDLNRKVEKAQIQRILEEGGVTQHPNSIWLLDFWAKKTVSGLLLMPVTRHQIGHINDSLKLKEKCKRLRQLMPMPSVSCPSFLFRKLF